MSTQETQSQFDKDMERLTDVSRRLLSLTEDPQPGLYTWNDICVRTLQEMKHVLDQIGVK